jgi:type IV secretory pathway TrbD component
LLVAGCWLLVAGYLLLVTGCWLLVTGCGLWVVGCWFVNALNKVDRFSPMFNTNIIGLILNELDQCHLPQQ